MHAKQTLERKHLATVFNLGTYTCTALKVCSTNLRSAGNSITPCLALRDAPQCAIRAPPTWSIRYCTGSGTESVTNIFGCVPSQPTPQHRSLLTHFTPMRNLAQVQGSDLISGRLPHDVLIVGRTLPHKAGPRCSTNRRVPAGPQSSTARGHPLALITTQPEGTILSCLPICIQPATYLGSGSP